jgi:hypothetical protein
MNVINKKILYFLAFFLYAISANVIAHGHSCSCGRGFTSNSSGGGSHISRYHGYYYGGMHRTTNNDQSNTVFCSMGFAFLFYFVFNWLLGLKRWLFPSYFPCSRPFYSHTFSWSSIFIFFLCTSLFIWCLTHSYLNLIMALLTSMVTFYVCSPYRPKGI